MTQSETYEAARLFPPRPELYKLNTLSPVDCFIFEPFHVDEIRKIIADELSMDHITKSKYLPDRVALGSNLNRLIKYIIILDLLLDSPT